MLHKCHFRSWVVKAFGIVIDALHREKTHGLEGPVQQNIEKADAAGIRKMVGIYQFKGQSGPISASEWIDFFSGNQHLFPVEQIGRVFDL